MKTADIPQDRNPAFAGQRKAVYALDPDGHYATTPSSGWQVEAIITGQAVEEYERLARDALQRARAGTASPLEFHMYSRRMEPPTLAGATGLWRCQVSRHLKPKGFARLSPAVLSKYANALGISIEALVSLPARGPDQ